MRINTTNMAEYTGFMRWIGSSSSFLSKYPLYQLQLPGSCFHCNFPNDTTIAYFLVPSSSGFGIKRMARDRL
ncbi:hypothetical protein Pint_01784 [Pistacia integerrima]|uniref:Uncharacterized protein n=1 Tax=Pistacia integerrima TaxID=434235 RepID=A0ACC0ZHH7_9ROSI|nr:hypothetical protein Pint_01784 [Pistacia integerrima]